MTSSELNWGMITGGGNFESLVHAILSAEDEDVILFGRPGRDSGQDARTRDGKTIYQAKYHNNMTMATAITDAERELTKIKCYREHNHPNYPHWQQVTKWVLVGNFDINPNDKERWDKDIVPGFKDIKIEASFWDKTTLENKLRELQHVQDVFFGGRNRIFLGLTEAYTTRESFCGIFDVKIISDPCA